jgi:hypothetical protein
MKPKRLPRLWCAMQGLLPLERSRPLPLMSAARSAGRIALSPNSHCGGERVGDRDGNESHRSEGRNSRRGG